MDTKKMRACAPLLPEPGDKVVCECLGEIERLRKICMSAKEALYSGAKDDLEVADMLEAAFLTPNAFVTGLAPGKDEK